jgi:hypothetical protein
MNNPNLGSKYYRVGEVPGSDLVQETVHPDESPANTETGYDRLLLYLFQFMFQCNRAIRRCTTDLLKASLYK